MKKGLTIVDESFYDPALGTAICNAEECMGCGKDELVKVVLPGSQKLKMKLCLYRCYDMGFCWRCGHFMALERWFSLNMGGDSLCSECHAIAKEAAPEMYQDQYKEID